MIMNDEQLKNTLAIVTNAVKDKEFHWRLEGTANLRIQGVTTTMRDLDITTTNKGIMVFREALKQYIIKDEYSNKIRGPSLTCDVQGTEVEINAYGDRELDLFDKQETITWQGLSVPVLPLMHAKEFYKAIRREEKVKMIEEHLASN